MTPAKKPPGFVLPDFRQKRKKDRDTFNGLLSHAALSMASDERILAETPSLKALYEFLGKKP